MDRGECDGEAEYADLLHNSTMVSDLSIYPWIKDVESYFCMEPL